MVGIIVGTGIGSGLILDGKLYRGRDGGAGNIGHTTIDPSGSKCGCGHFGHFESWCSGKHIVKRYVAAGGRTAAPHPARIFASRDPVAMNVMAETYDKFGLGLANVVNTLNPEIIVLGGGVSNLPGPFYKSLRSALRRHGNPAMSSVKIIRGKLGDSAGILGAVAVAAGY